ncbi:MAG: hypothetical protein LQ340_006962 [Diploschistes diacapsis]|nr:MAG: hypothetical protein LQ340_006962 [Diploschistes diacapsis]
MAVIRSAPRSFRSLFAPQLRALPLQSTRFYADDSKQAEVGSGIQKQGDKNARPVILEHAPPAQETEEVKKHNQEFEKRPDRSVNRIGSEDKQKVGKQFWSGEECSNGLCKSKPAN